MKKIIIANWKMNPSKWKEAESLFESLKKKLKGLKKAEVVVCPPFVYLQELRKKRGSGIKLGAQNCFWEEEGAFTGEISPKMLKDLGVKYVILGHSERRRLFAESNEIVAKKIRIILKFNLIPVLCIGETEEERKRGLTFEVLEKQIKESLKGVPKSKLGSVIIAYEPVWAIGTENPCSSDQASRAVLFIKKVIVKNFSREMSKKIKILYGGSVDSKNAKYYLIEDWIDGLLVGSSSLNSKEFSEIVRIASTSA